MTSRKDAWAWSLGLRLVGVTKGLLENAWVTAWGEVAPGQWKNLGERLRRGEIPARLQLK